MARWRQPGAGEMLQVFLLLSVFAFVLSLLWRLPCRDLARRPSWSRFSASSACRAVAGSRG